MLSQTTNVSVTATSNYQEYVPELYFIVKIKCYVIFLSIVAPLLVIHTCSSASVPLVAPANQWPSCG